MSQKTPESTAKKAFDFNSTVHSRRLLTLVYHSAHSISNTPPNVRRVFPADRPPHGLPAVDSGAWTAPVTAPRRPTPRGARSRSDSGS
eukprot:1191944-Prorocentrum_minimum.AAC.1